jgi:S-DNA-T family DNA segregation ATPase FtsK/SpoIIIE
MPGSARPASVGRQAAPLSGRRGAVRASSASASAVRQQTSQRRRKPAPREAPRLNGRVVGGLLSLLALLAGAIALLAVLMPSGSIGGPLARGISQAVGWTAPLLPLWPIVLGLRGLLRSVRPDLQLPGGRLWGAALAHLALIGLFHLLALGGPGGLARAQAGAGGGLVGFGLAAGLSDTLGGGPAMVLLFAALALGLLLSFDITLSRAARFGLVALLLTGRWLARTVRAQYQRRRTALRVNTGRQPGLAAPLPVSLGRLVRREPAAPREARPSPAAVPALDAPTAPTPPAGSEKWALPPLSLFESSGPVQLSEIDARQRALIIEETLQSFNIEARVVEVNQGPTVTQFGIEPSAGVAVRRILALQNDLGLRLGAWPVRFEAPVPGKRVVGLEVPNQSVALVSIRSLLESEEMARSRGRLRLALGRDVSGRPVVADLARMPHLLIAGATGSGKSVCINSILASLLSQNTPDELQFLMVDPKMVELMPFNGTPHLRMPVVTDMDQVVGALKWVVREMERRYAQFVKRAARNIESYNRGLAGTGEPPLPYLVVVIDELADMMMTAPDEVELLLCRLAQKARATGIHLIVATQRPSVDVLTGMIKANFVTRIAFAVSSQIDSRVILDTPGAEKLLGRGDMLFSSGDISKPQRIQGAWVSDEELQRLVVYWKRLGLPRYTEDEVDEMVSLSQHEETEDGDELYGRAVEVATQYSRVSTSLLQRRLGVGYPRAARLIDLMEARGVISTSEDGRSREVLTRGDELDDGLDRPGGPEGPAHSP